MCNAKNGLRSSHWAVDAEKVSLNKDISELYGAKIVVVNESTKLLPAMASALRAAK